MAAGGGAGFAQVDQTVEEGAGGEDHGGAAQFAAVFEFQARDVPVFDDEVVDGAFDDREAGGGADR